MLLNYLPGFNYTKAERAKEKIKIHEFVRKLITNTTKLSNAKETVKKNKSAITTTESMIKGTITSQGLYKSDNQYICELIISRDSSDMLPHECNQKKHIDMTIGNILYEAGVHEKKNGEVWISSVLYEKKREKKKVRLVDALADIRLKNGDKVKITINCDGSFILKGQ